MLFTVGLINKNLTVWFKKLIKNAIRHSADRIQLKSNQLSNQIQFEDYEYQVGCKGLTRQ